jgi:hypothetical protein
VKVAIARLALSVLLLWQIWLHAHWSVALMLTLNIAHAELTALLDQKAP